MKNSEDKMDKVIVDSMINAIAAVMPRLSVHDRRVMYRFTYIVCSGDTERGSMPPVPELTSRTKVLLREADPDDVRRVFKLMRTLEMRNREKMKE